MLKELTLAAALALTTPAVVAAQTSATPEQMADTFFAALKAGDPARAYKGLWHGTLMDKQQAQVEFVITQTSVALQTYGPIDGWELISEKIHSESYKERIYLVRADGAPLFFKLKFYRGPHGWMVHQLDFRDKLEALP